MGLEHHSRGIKALKALWVRRRPGVYSLTLYTLSLYYWCIVNKYLEIPFPLPNIIAYISDLSNWEM